MVGQCSVPGCLNRSDGTNKRTIFAFPKPYPNDPKFTEDCICLKWLRNIGIENETSFVFSNRGVCEDHFLLENIRTSTGKKGRVATVLVKGALPTEFIGTRKRRLQDENKVRYA